MTTRGITVLAGGLKETQEITRLAEAAGFEAAWSGEFLHRSGIVSAAAMAAVTTRIGVGTSIAYAVGRSPLVLANDARFLDEMSDGRFTLGLGTGTRRMMTDWHGGPHICAGYVSDTRSASAPAGAVRGPRPRLSRRSPRLPLAVVAQLRPQLAPGGNGSGAQVDVAVPFLVADPGWIGQRGHRLHAGEEL
jgi:Luciferase-like monooxygenase